MSWWLAFCCVVLLTPAFCDQSECTAGQYYFSGTSACLDCGAGHYQSASGQSNCRICAAGRYASENASSSCTNCTYGKYSVDLAAESESVCTSCPQGMYASNSNFGYTVCDYCSSGSYANALGFSICYGCAPGRYSTVIGAVDSSVCSECPEGRYGLVAAGKSDCEYCVVGTYGTSKGVVTDSFCINCPVGSFATTEGMSASTGCTDCPMGKFGSSTPRSDCEDCAYGKWSYDFGASVCVSFPTVSPSKQPLAAVPSLSPSHLPTSNSSAILVSPDQSLGQTVLNIISSPYFIVLSSAFVVCIGFRVFSINTLFSTKSKNKLGRASAVGLGISCLDFWTDVKFVIIVSKEPQFSGLWKLSLGSLFGTLAKGMCVIVYVLRKDGKMLDEDRFRKFNFSYSLVLVIAFTQVEALVLLPWKYPLDQRFMRGFPSVKSMYLSSLTVFIENIPQIFLQTYYLMNHSHFSIFVALSLMLSVFSLVMKIVRLTVFRFLESLPKEDLASNNEKAQKATVEASAVL